MKRKNSDDCKPEGAERILLTQDGASWIDTLQAPPDLFPEDMLEQLLALKPEEHGKIKMFGKEMDVPRFVKSFGQDYTFSGVRHTHGEMPALVQRIIDWANTTRWATTGGWTFNEALLNWYMDGSHYIGAHSDDEKQLDVRNGETLVLGISWGAERIFRMRPKKVSGKDVKTDIVLKPGMVFVMGGTCQRTHTHQVPKIGGEKGKAVGPRVSLTLRCFSKELKLV